MVRTQLIREMSCKAFDSIFNSLPNGIQSLHNPFVCFTLTTKSFLMALSVIPLDRSAFLPFLRLAFDSILYACEMCSVQCEMCVCVCTFLVP